MRHFTLIASVLSFSLLLASCGSNGPAVPTDPALPGTPITPLQPTPGQPAPVPAPAPVPVPAPAPALALDQSGATLEEDGLITVKVLNLRGGDTLEFRTNAPGVIQSYDGAGNVWTLRGAASMIPADVDQQLIVVRDGQATTLRLKLRVNGHKVLPPSYPGRGSNAEERRMLDLVNAVRASGAACSGVAMPPAPAMAWDDALFSSGLNHSRDQLARGYYAHLTPEGVTPAERDFLAGFRPLRGSAENIYSMKYQNGDTSTANTDAAFKGWMNSAGHCQSIMNPLFTQFGVAYHDGEPVTGSAPSTPRMWSMELAVHN